MKADKLHEVVSGLSAYPIWFESNREIDNASQGMPVKDENSPQWLRAQAELIELRNSFVDTTQLLQAEVITEDIPIKLPYKLGLLRGLQRFASQVRAGSHIRDSVGILQTTMNLTFSGETPDLKHSDFKHGSEDPFIFGSQIGDAISVVEKKLKINRKHIKTTPGVVLTVGRGQSPHTLYEQPTDVEYYRVVKPESGIICDEPRIFQEDDELALSFNLPKLNVIRANFNQGSKLIVPVKDREVTKKINLPDIEMLDSFSAHVNPKKLILGRAAIIFAAKHAIDMQKYKADMRRRAESRERLSRMRY